MVTTFSVVIVDSISLQNTTKKITIFDDFRPKKWGWLPEVYKK